MTDDEEVLEAAEVAEPPGEPDVPAPADSTDDGGEGGDADSFDHPASAASDLGDWRVRLEVFEGPLDLLLYLIRKEEVDIYDIPIVRVTEQYMEYLEAMRMLDLNIAGEFLVMASTLTLIKSRMLLPVEERPEEEDDDGLDPRLDLVRQLVEYRKFKDAADHLERLEEDQLNVFPRGAVSVELEKEPGVSLRDVSIFDLINAFNAALKKVEKENLHNIFTERYTVAEKIDDLMIRLRANQSLSVSRLFDGMRSRQEIICTFLAVLELIRLKQIEAGHQEGPFGEIVITRAAQSDESMVRKLLDLDELETPE